MTLALQSCVLPSPPLEKVDPGEGLELEFSLLEPVVKQPIPLPREPGESQRFSVSSAVSSDQDSAINVFWYIDFDPESPVEHTTEGNTITLFGCDALLLGEDGKLVSVEALITHGDIEFDESFADPRVTADGTTVLRAQWFVKVTGSVTGCFVQ